MNRSIIMADRTSRFLTAVLAIFLASAPVAAQTINQNIGGGIGFSFDGGISGKAGAAAPASCTSGSNMNGKFDLTNTCNDIYLLTGVI